MDKATVAIIVSAIPAGVTFYRLVDTASPFFSAKVHRQQSISGLSIVVGVPKIILALQVVQGSENDLREGKKYGIL